MSQADWFQDEVASVKWRNFYVFGGPVPAGLFADEARRLTLAALPQEYERFIRRWGAAKLFRRGLGHELLIFRPAQAEVRDGRFIFAGGPAGDYGFPLLPMHGARASVWLGRRKIAETFSGWLSGTLDKIKKTYTQREWRMLQAGPPPFTPAEAAVTAARGKFRVKFLGKTEHDKGAFEVYNGSAIKLPVYSVGVRMPNLEGGAYLKTGGVGPGQTRRILHDCYLDLYPDDPQE